MSEDKDVCIEISLWFYIISYVFLVPILAIKHKQGNLDKSITAAMIQDTITIQLTSITFFVNSLLSKTTRINLFMQGILQKSFSESGSPVPFVFWTLDEEP